MLSELDSVLRHQIEDADLEHTLDEARDRIRELSDFLEEMRESNDELRKWGTEMEEKADELQKELDNVETV